MVAATKPHIIRYSTLRPDVAIINQDQYQTLVVGLEAAQLYQRKFPDIYRKQGIAHQQLRPATLLNITRSLLIALSHRYFPFEDCYEFMGDFETNGNDNILAPLQDTQTTDEEAVRAFAELGHAIFDPYPIVFGLEDDYDTFIETEGHVLALALWTIARENENTPTITHKLDERFENYTEILRKLPTLPKDTNIVALCAAATPQFDVDFSAVLTYAFGIGDNWFACYTPEMVNNCYPPLGNVNWFSNDELLDEVAREYRAAEHMYSEYWKLAHSVTKAPTQLSNIATYLVQLAAQLPQKEQHDAT